MTDPLVTAKRISVQVNNKQRQARYRIVGWRKVSNIWRNTLVLLRPWQWIFICLLFTSAGIAGGLMMIWPQPAPVSATPPPVEQKPLFDPAVDAEPLNLKFSTTLSQPSK